MVIKPKGRVLKTSMKWQGLHWPAVVKRVPQANSFSSLLWPAQNYNYFEVCEVA